MAVNLIREYTHDKPVMTEEEFKKEFVKRLDYKMFAKGLNCPAIATMLGVCNETVRSYKRGDILPNVYTCVRLAKILDCDLNYIIGFADDIKY